MPPSPQLDRLISVTNTAFFGLAALALLTIIVTGRRLYRWYFTNQQIEGTTRFAYFPVWSLLWFICASGLLIFLVFLVGPALTKSI